MSAFVTHFTFEFGTGLRNRSLLLMTYLLPLGFYAVMGGVMAEINPPFRQMLIPAMVAFAVISGAMLGLPDPLVAARESGILRSYRINGVPALSILTIPALTTLLHTAIVSAIVGPGESRRRHRDRRERGDLGQVVSCPILIQVFSPLGAISLNGAAASPATASQLAPVAQ
jgi:hypothetical protein